MMFFQSLQTFCFGLFADVPTPYNILPFRTELCERLKESNKLTFFPDLYWALEMVCCSVGYFTMGREI